VKFQRLAILFIFMAAVPAVAAACTCSDAPPGQCPGLQASDVVFLGTVTEAQLVPPEEAAAAMTQAQAPPSENAPPDLTPQTPAPAFAPTPGGESAGQTGSAATGPTATAQPVTPTYRYHFHVDERFAGPAQAEFDVFSGGDDGDCGYRFQKGEQYIVYTQQETGGRLFATICNGTRLSSEGVALIPQLRAMRDGRRVASVFGVLRRSDPPFLSPPDDPADPIPSISLKLRSSLDRFQTNSGRDGVYNFYDVHEGTYNFTANLPDGTELTHKQQNAPLSAFSIPDGACYEYDVYALPTGHIRGSILGPDGKPVAIASLELYRVGAYSDTRPGYWGFQGATGAYQFDHVGPGQYVLVYNRAGRMDPNSPFPREFYPGVASVDKAKPITLKDGQTLEKVNMKLSNGYASRVVRVQLKWTGARPAGDVTVAAKADQFENPSVTKAAEDVYEFSTLDKANYTVSAWEDLAPGHAARTAKGACALPPRIDAQAVTVAGDDKATKTITLVFPKPGCANQ
jgi:hypothetical protein